MIIKNILHRHKYKIIGTCDNRDISYGKINGIHVDIMCKCGKYGTVLVPEQFREKVFKQASKRKYFNTPIVCVEEVINEF